MSHDMTVRAAQVVGEVLLSYYDRIGEGPSDRRLYAAELANLNNTVRNQDTVIRVHINL